MRIHDKERQNKLGIQKQEISTKQNPPFVNYRPETKREQRLQETINNSPQVQKARQYQLAANNSPQIRKARHWTDVMNGKQPKGNPIQNSSNQPKCTPPKDKGRTKFASGDYDETTGIYKPSRGDTPYSVAKRFGIRVDQIPEMKAGIPYNMCDYIPVNSIEKEPSKEKSTATPTKPDNSLVIRIAWTFDDGPTKFTPAMEEAMGGVANTTWYIQYDYYAKNREANKVRYKRIIDNGGEIAIHSVHPDKNHANWFPSANIESSHKSIQEAVNNLDIFNAMLKEDGLTAKFVRVPTGLHSEIIAYLKVMKVKGNLDQVARAIIDRKDVPEGGAQTVKKDYDYLISALNSRGLHLWGGRGKGKPEVSYNSWEAETSGVKGRTDNTTKHHNTARAATANGKNDRIGVFERTVDSMVKDQRPASLVILAHDTTKEDAMEVKADKLQMEKYAESNGVTIEYNTMTSLHETIRE